MNCLYNKKDLCIFCENNYAYKQYARIITYNYLQLMQNNQFNDNFKPSSELNSYKQSYNNSKPIGFPFPKDGTLDTRTSSLLQSNSIYQKLSTYIHPLIKQVFYKELLVELREHVKISNNTIQVNFDDIVYP